jgi:tRNA-(ms[2]io[6]A)-hydroxylase
MLCLSAASDPGWARAALQDLDAILVDHAHCEMKAAANALSLAARHGDHPRIARALTNLAREEIDHFQRVLRELDRRGLVLGAPPVDEYAAELRRASARLAPQLRTPLVDRLLVGALIEARSCERFKLLFDAMEGSLHDELRAFYGELLAAEARHSRVFVDLATIAAEGDLTATDVLARLSMLSVIEAAIVRRLAAGHTRATIHG